MKTMLRDALFLARTDVWRMLRARETLLWTFVMPVIFMYFIGTVTGSGGGSPGTKDDVAVIAPADAGFLADQLMTQLAARDYNVIHPSTRNEFLKYRRRLELPACFTDSVLAGKPAKIQFARTGEDLSTDYDRVKLYRAVYTILANYVVITQDGATASPEAFAKLADEPRPLGLDVIPAGKRLQVPTGFEQSVPGTMVMFTMLVLFTSGAVTLTMERNQGILRRLASSPMSRGTVVLGKWGARMGLGVIQITFAMVAATLLFHIRWGPNLPMVLLVLLAYGALAVALAMLLGNLGRTEGQVIGLGVVASNLLAGLGGCWWPIEITPLWTQKLAIVLPTGWTMDALHKLINFGASPLTAVPHLCVSVVAALGAGYIVSRTFRFQ